MGKLWFHLARRLEKRINSYGSILVLSITTRYPGFQITCYAAYSTLLPQYLTNCITARNPHKGIQQPRFGWLTTTSAWWIIKP
jgi:hypothetical protein